MHFALANLHSFPLPPLSSHNNNSNNKTSNSCIRIPFNGVFFSPPKSPSNFAGKAMAMASEGKDSLDHLQKPSKAKNLQQIPKRGIARSSPIGLWDRFPTARTVQQMMDTMDRIMEDPFAYTVVPFPSSDEVGGGGGGGYRKGRMPWEIKEGAEEYKMRFDMPGMAKSDVRVWVEENMLVVKAEKQLDKEGEEEEEEEEWSVKSFGKYSSRIALPENVEVEKITAEVKDGVLYITIPKASASSRVVDINVR